MSDRTTSLDTRNAISSLASEGGALLFASPDGQTKDLFGQEAAPVSRGAERDARKASTATSTFGQRGLHLFDNDDRLLSWESRLRQRLAVVGGTKWPTDWKLQVTPAGRQISELCLLGRHKRDGDSGLFPTPLASEKGYRKGKFAQGGTSLSTMLGGVPNPPWVAWLMGFPELWTNLAPSAMPSSRKSRQK